MEITKICLTCNGDGLIDWGTETRTCYSCYGTGMEIAGWTITNGSATLDERMTDLEDKVNDILDKCNDIFEKVNE